MRRKRDPSLEPAIDPPSGIAPANVRRAWPDAIEALEENEERGSLSVAPADGEFRDFCDVLVLWFEGDVPSTPMWWDPRDRRWREEPP